MITAARTHEGNIRPTNQDGYLLCGRDDGLFCAAVADGMGGHRAGNVASSIAMDALKECVEQRNEEPATELAERAVELANTRIFEQASDDDDCYGMGTTMSLALIEGDRIVYAHVGDSRIYLLHEGSLKRITHDHSLVQQLIDIGSIDEDEAAHHPQKNIITRAVGTSAHVEPDTGEEFWQVGDILVLCSDGLTGEMDDDTILQIASGEGSIDGRAQALLDAALASGGYDNITVVLLQNTGGVNA